MVGVDHLRTEQEPSSRGEEIQFVKTSFGVTAVNSCRPADTRAQAGRGEHGDFFPEAPAC